MFYIELDKVFYNKPEFINLKRKRDVTLWGKIEEIYDFLIYITNDPRRIIKDADLVIYASEIYERIEECLVIIDDDIMTRVNFIVYIESIFGAIEEICLKWEIYEVLNNTNKIRTYIESVEK